jgi:membrane protein DedA with SNARE-associated domain
VADWTTNLIESIGYAGIALLMFLEIPIPLIQSEIVMTFSGFTAERGDLNVAVVVLAGVIGSQVGSVALFALCRRLPNERVHELLERYGGWLGFDRNDLESGEARFRRHDHWAVLIGRLVPGLRSFVAVPAGISGMPFWRFFALNLVGAALWIGVLTYLGSVLGDNYDAVDQYSSYITYGLLGAFALYVLFRVVVIARRRMTADRS